MPISRADLAIYQGDDYNAVVLVYNGVPPEEIIAGYTAKAQIREGSADDFDEVLVEIGTTVNTPYVNLSIPAAATADLCAGQYSWDLEITSPAGVTTTILAGKARVTAEVTR